MAAPAIPTRNIATKRDISAFTTQAGTLFGLVSSCRTGKGAFGHYQAAFTELQFIASALTAYRITRLSMLAVE
ncbi:hypothetical protein RN347_12795 [Halomonas sp. PAMB 3264]|uniref:hypothetical protein n=1 Tax=Halomonas sp. PAMB 3264 TaxID=3075222 RepID=UPI002898E389|nr:hypothetical protein [Halomonas sp. PAMB 3264]WNL43991.1 hypothetical protein RN347_12795 [Halomonas sp. PAMB 3264]